MRISYGLAEREMAVILFSTIGGACNHAGGLIEKYPPPSLFFIIIVIIVRVLIRGVFSLRVTHNS